MTTVQALGAAVGGFACGMIPFGIVIGRVFYGRDPRLAGSGNIGAANALRTLGKKAGIAVLILDALKGFAPTALAGTLIGGDGAAIAAAAAVIGHCWSPLLGFRGGKGVATAYGAVFALAWPAGIVFTAAWIAGVVGTGYSSVGSLSAALLAIPTLWFLCGTGATWSAATIAAVVVWRHRENIGRLRAGTENTLTLRG